MIETRKANRKNLNEVLRQEIKLIRALQELSYKEMCEILNFNYSSFLSWIKGAYDYGEEKQNAIKEFISNIRGEL